MDKDIDRTYDTGDTPATMSALEGRTHHLDIARGIEGIIDTPSTDEPIVDKGENHGGSVKASKEEGPLRGLCDDVGLNSRALGQFKRVDAVRGTERSRDVELRGVDIDRKDATSFTHLCTLNDRETDSAKTEDRHRCTYEVQNKDKRDKNHALTCEQVANKEQIWKGVGTPMKRSVI